MKNIVIVKIDNPEKYMYVKNYGILQQTMEETAVINFHSNMGGICTNISHGDYHIVPRYLWEVIDGEVVILCRDEYINNGLKIWS